MLRTRSRFIVLVPEVLLLEIVLKCGNQLVVNLRNSTSVDGYGVVGANGRRPTVCSGSAVGPGRQLGDRPPRGQAAVSPASPGCHPWPPGTGAPTAQRIPQDRNQAGLGSGSEKHRQPSGLLPDHSRTATDRTAYLTPIRKSGKGKLSRIAG